MRIATALAFACLSIASLAVAVDAQAVMRHYDLNIPKQSLDTALRDLAQQTGLQIALFSDAIDGSVLVGPVQGKRSAEEALNTLLAPSGLTFKVVSEGTIAIIPPLAAAPLTSAYSVEVGRMRLAQVDESRSRTQEPEPRSAARTEDAEAKKSFPAEGDLIQTVIVTASKRSERIIDLPASVTALGSQEIEQRGLRGMEDYLRAVPGVSYIDRGVANNSIVIRGLTADAQNYTDMGGTVGIYLGDIPLAGLAVSGNNADIKLVDMERVEVLRGPQGTLYGDGALGGAVRNIPAAPDLERFEGTVQLGYSQTEKRRGDSHGNNELQGVANFPILEDQLALRVVGYRNINGGYIDNVAASNRTFSANAIARGFGDLLRDQDNIGNSVYEGGRATALWKPTQQLHATAMLLTQNLEQDGLPEVQLGRFGTGLYEQTRMQISPDYRGGSERLRDRISIANLEVGYDRDWGTLLSATSYIEEEGLLIRDIGRVGFGLVHSPQSVDLTTRVVVEELRFMSQFSGPLQVLGGFYYNDSKKLRYSDAFRLTTPLTVVDSRFFEGQATQKTLFGEVSYELTPRLKATGGMRAFTYDQTFTTTSYFTPVPTTKTIKNQDVGGETYKVNLGYQPTDDSLIYLQWAEGFRLGAPIAGPPPSVCDVNGDGVIDGTSLSALDRALQPDDLESFELGGKIAFPGRRASLSASLYRNDWSGIPMVILVPCGFGQFVNAGEARTQGMEFEGTVSLLDDLSISFGASYVDAELTKDAPGVGFKGDRLPGSPRYNVSTAVRYDFMLAELPAFVRADYLRTGGFYNNLAGTGPEIANYGLVNLRCGATFGSASIEVYVNNATNEDALTWADSVFRDADARASRLRPRTTGLTVKYQF